MILDKNQILQLFGEAGYSCTFNEKKFGYALLREQMSPFGNIISFKDKITIGPLHFKDSLIFCIELPNVNMYGAVCFQRLFSTLLGSLLSELVRKEVFVNEGCIFIEEKQSSISLINSVKSSGLVHIIFPCENSKSEFYSLSCTDFELEDFQKKSIDSFHQLTRSIFLQTQHDNF
jgi:hypothetical protein